MFLPPFISREEVHDRLFTIFPEGSPNRTYCTREISASTVFVMLYIGAIHNAERYLAPKHVYRMSNEQSENTSDAARIDYTTSAIKPGSTPIGKPWYADTTREPIRDETIRQGLIPVGAAIERKLPTTSPKPRYALNEDFVALFNPELEGDDLERAAADWREIHLDPSAIARVSLIRSGASPDPEDYIVTFPNGETQHLSPGESSIITKAVIERFAIRYLEEPCVIWVSESGNQIVARHDILAQKIGLNLSNERLLPDIILFDLAAMTIVFVEVVSTDGPITETRQTELFAMTDKAGYSREKIAFVTAFMDRGAAAFRRTLSRIAWNTFVWLASEPDALIALERKNDRANNWLHSRL